VTSKRAATRWLRAARLAIALFAFFFAAPTASAPVADVGAAVVMVAAAGASSGRAAHASESARASLTSSRARPWHELPLSAFHARPAPRQALAHPGAPPPARARKYLHHCSLLC